MAKSFNIKQERAILIAHKCTESEIKEYFLVFREMRTPNWNLKDWEQQNSNYINEVINLLKTEYVKVPRDLSRFLKQKGKSNAFRLKRRKSKSEVRKQLYFFIQSRASTTSWLLLKFLTDDLNIPLSDANELIKEFNTLNISGYHYDKDTFIRNADKKGIDGIQIEIIPNSKTIDFSFNNVTVGFDLVNDPKFCMVMLPLLAKALNNESDLVDYAQNIFTSYLGLKYGDN